MKFPLLPRVKKADKSRYGHTLIVAGCRNMPGAAVLAATAALRGGAGLVTLASPVSALRRMGRLPAEIMRLELPESAGAAASTALGVLASYILKRRCNALVIGPGLSTERGVHGLVRKLVRTQSVPMVLDADGLNVLSGHCGDLKRARGSLVVTPHEREFARLFGVKVPSAAPARGALAKKIAKFYDVVLVLKGHRTLVSDGKRLYRNMTGNPGMAKGGTGDVLTGLIAAFIAQGLKPFDAARWAVYLHGKAGDRAVKRSGVLGLTAGDIIAELPKVLR